MRVCPKLGPFQFSGTFLLFSCEFTQSEQASPLGGSTVDVAVSSSRSRPPAMPLTPPAIPLMPPAIPLTPPPSPSTPPAIPLIPPAMPLTPPPSDNPNAPLRAPICCRLSACQSSYPEHGGSPF